METSGPRRSGYYCVRLKHSPTDAWIETTWKGYVPDAIARNMEGKSHEYVQ